MFSKIVLSLGIEFYQTAILYHYILHIFPTAHRLWWLRVVAVHDTMKGGDPHTWASELAMVSLSSWAKTVKSTWHSTRVAVVHLDSPTLFCGNRLLLLHQKSQMVHLCSKSLNFGKIPKGYLRWPLFLYHQKTSQKIQKNKQKTILVDSKLYLRCLGSQVTPHVWRQQFPTKPYEQNTWKTKKTSTNSSCVRCVWVLKFMTVGPRIKSRRLRWCF